MHRRRSLPWVVLVSGAAAIGSLALLARHGGLGVMDGGKGRSTNDHLLEALLAADQETPAISRQSIPPSDSRKATGPTGSPQVRVALYRQFPVQQINATKSSRCSSQTQNHLKRIDLSRWTDPTLRCSSDSGADVLVNGKRYQGSIELVRESKGWLAINQLPLENYVASVVGSEMPSHWNTEALKAQAVAARSYALVHLVRPAGRQFHLGDTTRWQVYGGQESISGRTKAATEATHGQVLSFRGGLVESLYAATSEISAEAHGHLGASMSQTGANRLAQQGSNYAQILNQYYNGAELARIRLNGD